MWNEKGSPGLLKSSNSLSVAIFSAWTTIPLFILANSCSSLFHILIGCGRRRCAFLLLAFFPSLLPLPGEEIMIACQIMLGNATDSRKKRAYLSCGVPWKTLRALSFLWVTQQGSPAEPPGKMWCYRRWQPGREVWSRKELLNTHRDKSDRIISDLVKTVGREFASISRNPREWASSAKSNTHRCRGIAGRLQTNPSKLDVKLNVKIMYSRLFM